MRVGTALVKSPGEVRTKPKRNRGIRSCVRPHPPLSLSEVISGLLVAFGRCWGRGSCFASPPRAPQAARCPASDSNRGTGGGQQDGSGRARTCGASSTRSKGPQLVTSARKPLMPRPGAGRFTPGTHFPFPSQKSCVNLTFKKLCLIPFYSFSSLANCSAFFVIFVCFFGFVLTLCSVKSAHFGFITCSPGGWGRRRVALALCVCATAFGSSGDAAWSRQIRTRCSGGCCRLFSR